MEETDKHFLLPPKEGLMILQSIITSELLIIGNIVYHKENIHFSSLSPDIVGL